MAHRLIVNACRDEQRQAQRWRVHATVTDINTPMAGSELDAFVERNFLDSIFGKLSVEHRAVLVLHYYVGLSAPEVAAALGIPTGTVYSRLHYGTRECVTCSRSSANARPIWEAPGDWDRSRSRNGLAGLPA